MLLRIKPYFCPKCESYKPKRKVIMYRGVIPMCDSCGTALIDVKRFINDKLTEDLIRKANNV